MFAAAGTDVTMPTTPTQPARALDATVSPDTGLTNGQTVTVSWTGFTPGKTINIVQCSNRTPGDASACDLEHGKILQPDPTGSGSLAMEIVTGPVGSGVCDATTPNCQIVFNDGGSLDPNAERPDLDLVRALVASTRTARQRRRREGRVGGGDRRRSGEPTLFRQPRRSIASQPWS